MSPSRLGGGVTGAQVVYDFGDLLVVQAGAEGGHVFNVVAWGAIEDGADDVVGGAGVQVGVEGEGVSLVAGGTGAVEQTGAGADGQ